MKKKTKYILSFTGLLVLAILCAMFVFLRVDDTDISYVLYENGEENLGQLKKGDEIVQEIFMPEENHVSVEIFCATYENTEHNFGTLYLTLEDDFGNVIATKTVDIHEIEDWSYIKIKGDGRLVKSNRAVVRIKVESMGIGTMLTFLTTSMNDVSYDLYVNGTLKNRELSINLDYKDMSGYKKFVTILFALLLLTGVVILILLACNAKLHWVYLAAALGAGCVYLIALPVKMAPDELTHMVTAYRVSNSILGTDEVTDQGEILMRRGDVSTITGNTPRYQQILQLYHTFADKPTKEDLEIIQTNYTGLHSSAEAYWLSGLGITLGRVLKWNDNMTFLPGRIFNYLFFVGVTFFAIRRIPFGKITLFLVAMLPMVIQQAASYSYDNMVLAMMIAFVSYLCLFMNKKYEVKTGDVLFFLAVCLLVERMKSSAYLPLLFSIVIPVLRYRKDPEKKRFAYALFGVLAIILLAKVGDMGLSMITPSQKTAEDMNYYEMKDLTEDFWKPVLIFFNTIWIHSDFYLFSSFGSSLGSLDVATPQCVFVFYLLLIFISTFAGNKEETFQRGEKAWVLLLSFASAFGTCLALLFSWTTKDFMSVEGVQGRYFLPQLILLAFVLRTSLFRMEKDMSKTLALGGFVTHFADLVGICLYFIR